MLKHTSAGMNIICSTCIKMAAVCIMSSQEEDRLLTTVQLYTMTTEDPSSSIGVQVRSCMRVLISAQQCGMC